MELCVLHLLAHRPGYGYEIAQTLAQFQSLSLKESTLYLILARLERDHLVDVSLRASERGPKRRYFQLNADGRARLAAMSQYWQDMSADMAALLETKGQDHAQS